MNHIKTTARWKKFDIKIEARKFIEDITNKMKSSKEEKGISTQATIPSASNNIKIDMKLVQLKSYSISSIVSIFQM